MKNIYVVRADFGRYTEAFKENGYVGIGWFDFLMKKGIKGHLALLIWS